MTRIPALDGVRGAAILLVLVQHFTQYGVERPADGLGNVAFRALIGGWVGVDLFFVLSGFLITSILLRAKGEAGYFRNFYARRTLRIFPLYFAFLAVTVVVLPHLLPHHVRLQGWSTQGIWHWTYTTNIMAALHGWGPAEVRGLGHFWSLAVEEQFYLVWPLVVFHASARSLVKVCLAAVLTSILLRILLHASGYEVAAYTLMPARMDSLAAGALVAIFATTATPSQMWRFGLTAAGVGLGLLAIMALVRRTTNPEDAIVQTLGYSLIALTYAGIIAAIAGRPDGALARPLRSAPLAFFGRYSYGLYVIHQPILFLVPIPTIAGMLAGFGAPRPAALAISITAVFSLCVGLAFVSWHALEKQALKYKDRFPQHAHGGPIYQPAPTQSPGAVVASGRIGSA